MPNSFMPALAVSFKPALPGLRLSAVDFSLQIVNLSISG